MALGEWVQEVSRAYFNCSLGLLPAANLVGAQPSELQASLLLASLEDKHLELVSKYGPPATTWFFLAECPADDFEELLISIDTRENDEAAADVAQRVLKEKLGPSISDSIAALDSRVFFHLHSKAVQSKALSEKNRGALKNFGGRLKQIGRAHV